jgi:hypothetical protein
VSYAQLGSYRFRVSPSNVIFPYQVDSVTIPTVGGRVVQVYGVTLGDIIVQGLFGQDRANRRESWQLAEEFQAAVGGMVQRQSKAPTTGQLAGYDPATMHPPVRFLYTDDTPDRRAAGLPIHNWDFQVYIKSLQDSDDPNFTVSHSTGKYSYGYTLTLFMVEDNSRILRQVAIDKFINRLTEGVGWKRTVYNGPMNPEELKAYVAANSPDGTIHGLVLKQMQEAANGGVGITGGAAQGAALGRIDQPGATPGLPGSPSAPAAPPTPGGVSGSSGG